MNRIISKVAKDLEMKRRIYIKFNWLLLYVFIGLGVLSFLQEKYRIYFLYYILMIGGMCIVTKLLKKLAKTKLLFLFQQEELCLKSLSLIKGIDKNQFEKRGFSYMCDSEAFYDTEYVFLNDIEMFSVRVSTDYQRKTVSVPIINNHLDWKMFAFLYLNLKEIQVSMRIRNMQKEEDIKFQTRNMQNEIFHDPKDEY